jgi:hypothetical protein
VGGIGVGGAGGGGGVDGTGCGGAQPGLDVVSDFESGLRVVLAQGSPLRSGRWVAANDGMTGCTETPSPDDTAFAAEPIEGGGRCGSQYAMRFVGAGCAIFAAVSADLAPQPPPDASADGGVSRKIPYDLSGYKQVRFFARTGVNATPKNQYMQFSLPMLAETLVAEGGDCSLPEVGSARCGAHYGRFVPITPTWNEYVVDLDPTNRTTGISQETWGQAFTWDPQSVISLRFQAAGGVNFDFWIDDISLVPK